jgi:hypothetical protein
MIASVVTVQRGPERRKQFEEARCPECDIAFGPFQRRDLPTEEGWTGHFDEDMGRLPSRLAVALQSRFDLNVAMCDEKLSPEQRAWLIREPFRALAHEHADRKAESRSQKSISAIVQLATIVVLVATSYFWYEHEHARPGEQAKHLLWALGLSVLTLWMLGWVVWRQVRWNRITARPMAGLVSKMLGPIGPTATELDLAIAELRLQKNSVARGLRTSDLTSA